MFRMMQVERVNWESPSGSTSCAMCASSFSAPCHHGPLARAYATPKKIELYFRVTYEPCMHLMHMNERTECQ